MLCPRAIMIRNIYMNNICLIILIWLTGVNLYANPISEDIVEYEQNDYMNIAECKKSGNDITKKACHKCINNGGIYRIIVNLKEATADKKCINNDGVEINLNKIANKVPENSRNQFIASNEIINCGNNTSCINCLNNNFFFNIASNKCYYQAENNMLEVTLGLSECNRLVSYDDKNTCIN